MCVLPRMNISTPKSTPEAPSYAPRPLDNSIIPCKIAVITKLTSAIMIFCGVNDTFLRRLFFFNTRQRCNDFHFISSITSTIPSSHKQSTIYNNNSVKVNLMNDSCLGSHFRQVIVALNLLVISSFLKVYI